jgi:hypothetical protein
MRHAYRNAIRPIPKRGRDGVMYIGWDRDGQQLLEVGVLDPYSVEPCIIHAKEAREKFLRRLRK